jgi:hypothetical protein
VTCGTGGSSGRAFIGVAGGGMGGNCGGARYAARYLATHPSPRCCNAFARSVVLRVLLLEEWQHMLGTVGGPERLRPLLLFVEPLGVLNLHRSPSKMRRRSPSERAAADAYGERTLKHDVSGSRRASSIAVSPPIFIRQR